MPHYLSDRELYYEIIISKGKGQLTKKAERMFILIANNMMKKMEKKYKKIEDKEDSLQTGLMHLFTYSKWSGFNENKYSTALPYFTEIFKRGTADGLNTIYSKKTYNDDYIKFISLTNCNNGKGLSNI
jgi:hypothetical protein